MSSNRPGRYKTYLEPDSDEPILSSSWYRNKKKHAQKVNIAFNSISILHLIYNFQHRSSQFF